MQMRATTLRFNPDVWEHEDRCDRLAARAAASLGAGSVPQLAEQANARIASA